MKSINLCYILLLVLFAGCSDFLKEEDKDLVIPRTVEHYEAMINTFYVDPTHYLYSDLMTDNVEDCPTGMLENKNEFKSIFTWQLDLELSGDKSKNAYLNDAWEKHYKIIATLNYVLDEIDRAEGDAAMKTYLKGVACFMRAKSYFELVNLYAPHYDKETAKEMPGVPLRLSIGVEDTYGKNSIEEVYASVERDLKNAISRIEQSRVKKNIWYVNTTAAKLLLSRVYLYKSDYANSELYATQVLEATGGLLWDLGSFYNDPVVTYANPEIIHTYGDPKHYMLCDRKSGHMKPYFNGGVNYRVSNELMSSWLYGDRRRSTYLLSEKGVNIPARVSGKYTSLGAFTYRTSEAYLNRAESRVMQGNVKGAHEDVAELVKHRTKYVEEVQIPGEQEALRLFISLCGEEFPSVS